MTVSVADNKDIYTGNGSTKNFQYNFKILQASDLLVQTETGNNVFTTHTLNSDYTVSGTGDENGGTVSFSVAPAQDIPVILYGQFDLLQETDFEEGDSLPAETLEDRFDKTVMVLNRLSEHINRSIAFKVTTTVEDQVTLPDPEASKILGWNSAADNLENVTNPAVAAAASASAASSSASAASTSETNAAASAAAAAASAASVSGVSGGSGAPFNYIINSDFSVEEYGTQDSSGGIGIFNKWGVFWTGEGSAAITEGGFDDRSSLKVSVDLGVDPTVSLYISQAMEDVRRLAGKTVTLSFLARMSTDVDAPIAIEFVQNFGTGGSEEITSIDIHQITIEGSAWTTYEATFTIPALSEPSYGTGHYTAINFWISAGSNYNSRTDSLGCHDSTLYITDVQLEEGSTASTYVRRHQQEELALCRRYFYETTCPAAGYYKYSTNGNNRYVGHIDFPVTMRTTPTTTVSNEAYTNCSSMYTSQTTNSCALYCTVTAPGVYRVTGATYRFHADLYDDIHAGGGGGA